MNKNKSVAEQIVSFLLDIKAIQINLEHPFIWASGWRSPIYCDNRLSLSYPEIRKYISKAITDLINKNFKDVKVIAGVATAGIPQGVLVADSLDLPFLYVRAKAKGHGLTNRIEGKIIPGQKAVVIEDLVSTGNSAIAAVDSLRKAGMNVPGMVSVFTYGFKESYEFFDRKKIEYYALSDYDALLRIALKRGYIQPEEREKLEKWRKDPGSWS